MGFEVLRRGGENPPGFSQLPDCDPPVSFELACPDRHVDTVVDDVEITVSGDDIDRDIGITRDEGGQQRLDVQQAEGKRSRHPQQSLWVDDLVLDHRLGFAHVGEDRYATPAELDAGLRQEHLACGAWTSLTPSRSSS